MDVNVAYSSSDSYMRCTAVSILSLFENNVHIDDLNVFLISSDLTESSKARLQIIAKKYSRSIQFIDASKHFEQLRLNVAIPPFRESYAVYFTLIADQIFPDIDKLLVIDSDTLVVGSILDLWQQNLDDSLLGLVPEIGLYGKLSSSEDNHVLYKHDLYFNTGVLLYNLKRWREQGINAYLIDKINNYPSNFKIYDQSILNIFLNEDIIRLRLKYNYYGAVHGVSYNRICRTFNKKIVFDSEEYLEAKKNPVILHFTGRYFERPWYKAGASPYGLDYKRYMMLTPWVCDPLLESPTINNPFTRVYYETARLLRVMKLYNLYHWYRYVLGQKLKIGWRR